MSAWGDMMRRGAGEEVRTEDIYDNPLVTDNPITFIGNIDKSTIPSIPTAGQLYSTNDEVTINGVTFPSGCLLLYDGTKWINVCDFLINH